IEGNDAHAKSMGQRRNLPARVPNAHQAEHFFTDFMAHDGFPRKAAFPPQLAIRFGNAAWHGKDEAQGMFRYGPRIAAELIDNRNACTGAGFDSDSIVAGASGGHA